MSQIELAKESYIRIKSLEYSISILQDHLKKESEKFRELDILNKKKEVGDGRG